MSDDETEMQAADISKERASTIISAIYTCGNSLAGLQPGTRLIVLRALCVTFLEHPKKADERMEIGGGETSPTGSNPQGGG